MMLTTGPLYKIPLWPARPSGPASGAPHPLPHRCGYLLHTSTRTTPTTASIRKPSTYFYTPRCNCEIPPAFIGLGGPACAPPLADMFFCSAYRFDYNTDESISKTYYFLGQFSVATPFLFVSVVGNTFIRRWVRSVTSFFYVHCTIFITIRTSPCVLCVPVDSIMGLRISLVM